MMRRGSTLSPSDAEAVLSISLLMQLRSTRIKFSVFSLWTGPANTVADFLLFQSMDVSESTVSNILKMLKLLTSAEKIHENPFDSLWRFLISNSGILSFASKFN
jgi:hypothetical protein